MSNTHWKIDKEGSKISFEIRHLLISHIVGEFKIFEGSLLSSDFEFQDANLELELDVYSLDTNDTGNDELLKTNAFFDADDFPSIKIVSTSFTKVQGDLHTLTCEVTFLGTTQSIDFTLNFGGQAKDGFGISRAPLEINGVIDRNLFVKIVEKQPGMFGLGHELKLHADLQFVRTD